MKKKLIFETAKKSTAIQFIEFLRSNDLDYEILEADNLLNYNEGILHIGVNKLQDAVLFINGKNAD